ncbi:sce7725 family protein [Leptospira noguchii]|uniref:Sce7725 family protein n=1 Tax=Leptospira noguchii TaxID=28182 RepID=A0AAE9G9W7_9LEPT|nr:sce7725 family protein [Leptospira noguchii]UOG30237.1 sce7725 family protein [Leptospira noguchii]UOG56359.1 sce7725 family protein [Leptospira noguchii]
MYYPFFRGKQFELTTITNLSDELINSGKIIPIVEPVSNNRDMKSHFPGFVEKNLPLILIVNPFYPRESPLSITEVESLFISPNYSYSNLIPAILINSNTLTRAEQGFITRYRDKPITFIHFQELSNTQWILGELSHRAKKTLHVFYDGKISQTYQNIFKSRDKIILRDCFHTQAKNANYPPDEFFSDLYFNYQSLGYSGFSDFSIVGDSFGKGGRAHAVAIHFVYPEKTPINTSNIRIAHFLSDTNGSPTNPGGKYIEALGKLISFVNQNPRCNFGKGVAEFRSNHNQSHFPGLGVVKKISMIHHMELIFQIL